MTILVTGSAGHLGEAILRTLRGRGSSVHGVDLKASPFTDAVGSIVDAGFVRRQMGGATAVIHAATLHKPHLATHSRQDFIDTNVTGTLNLLEAAVAAGVRSFVFTSTTSAFGSQLRPDKGHSAGLGHRGSAVGPEEHLRHQQADGGDSVRAVRSRAPSSRGRAQDLALLSGRGRRSGSAGALHDGERAGE
jgi:nucleoside-diphosphate-sugar epimerase